MGGKTSTKISKNPFCYHPRSEGARNIYTEFIQKHFKTVKSHDELVKEKEKEIMSKKNSSATPSAKRANTKTFKLDFYAKNISTTEESRNFTSDLSTNYCKSCISSNTKSD